MHQIIHGRLGYQVIGIKKKLRHIVEKKDRLLLTRIMIVNGIKERSGDYKILENVR